MGPQRRSGRLLFRNQKQSGNAKEARLPYTIEYLPDRGYTLTTVEGQATPELAIELMIETLSVAKKSKCQKFLVDLRGATVLSATIDTFELPGKVEALGFTAQHRLAIVYSTDESDLRFLELVSQNRGLQVKAFEDFDEAETWLK
jgi:hypothetical protein